MGAIFTNVGWAMQSFALDRARRNGEREREGYHLRMALQLVGREGERERGREGERERGREAEDSLKRERH